MKVDYLSCFRQLLLMAGGRYEESFDLGADIFIDIRRAVGEAVCLMDWYGQSSIDILREQDELYSIEWLQKAAGMGYFQANCILGLYHLVGKWVEKDCRRAVSLLEASAKSAAVTTRPILSDGFALVCVSYATPDYVLGCIFSSDEFVAADYTKALRHYERAAKMGDYYALLGALRILEGADGTLPIDIEAAEGLCADVLVDNVIAASTESFKHPSHGPNKRRFLLKRLEDYAKIARYKLQGEVLPLARWSQKTGVPQQVLEERISRGLPDADVLRPLDETGKAECDKDGVPLMESGPGQPTPYKLKAQTNEDESWK